MFIHYYIINRKTQNSPRFGYLGGCYGNMYEAALAEAAAVAILMKI